MYPRSEQISPVSLTLGKLGELWRWLRQASGDDAYERYLAHMHANHPEAVVLDRSAYYCLRLEQKWNRITRCC